MEEKVSRLQTHLALIRNCAGWSASTLGEKLDVSRQMVSNLENGRNSMTVMQYRAIRQVISEEFENAPEDTQMLKDVVRVLIDAPEEFTLEQRSQVLSDANLLAPAIVTKKTTRKNASAKWVTALAGVLITATAIGVRKHLKNKN